MKNRHLSHSHQSAKIYRHHYKPSLNFIRLMKSVLSIFISGSAHAASTNYRKH